MASAAMWKLRLPSSVAVLCTVPGRNAAQTGERHDQIDSPFVSGRAKSMPDGCLDTAEGKKCNLELYW